MKSEFVGNGRWDRDFSFLDKCGLATVYLTILGLAQSVTEIRKLIDLLPAYCRLLRNDVIRLEKFWQEEIGKKNPKVKGRVLSPAQLSTFEWLLSELCPEQLVATEYYRRSLVEGAQTQLTDLQTFVDLGSQIMCPEMAADGSRQHFRAVMFGQVFWLGCWLLPDKQTILVRFTLYQIRLSEQITHSLLSLPPYGTTIVNEGSSRKGAQVNLCYIPPTDKLMPYIDTTTCMVRPGFIEMLIQWLQETGLPLEEPGVSVSSPGEEF